MPGGWTEFALAALAFFASHALPARTRMRRLAAAIGERTYLALYSLLSLVVLGWLIAAAGRAPHVPLWGPAPWQAWVPSLAMPIACLLATFGIGAVNPFSFAGRRPEAFDPDRPGIAGVTRHPLLVAVLLWAGSHLVANGDLAHVLLFGSFAAFAAVGMVDLDRRRRRDWGAAEWDRRARRTGLVPGAALFAGRWRPHGPPDRRRLALGLGLWLALLGLHPVGIGVSPLPP
jgi:uncharacterized membrane protein